LHPPFFLFLAWWPSWLEVGITGHVSLKCKTKGRKQADKALAGVSLKCKTKGRQLADNTGFEINGRKDAKFMCF
jgi:hypothetical protein